MNEALTKKLAEIIQTVWKLNNDNALYSSECLIIVRLFVNTKNNADITPKNFTKER